MPTDTLAFTEQKTITVIRPQQVLIIIAMTFGLLFVFSAMGILKLVIGFFPNLGTVGVGGGISLPISATIAIVLVSFLATLTSVGINEVTQTKTSSGWTYIIVMAILSAAIWIIFPQILPKEIQLVAGTAQSLFTSQLPQGLLMP